MIGGEYMQFYPPDPRRRPTPPPYRQRVMPPNQFQRQDDSFFYLNQVTQQNPFLPPNNQPQVSRFSRLPDHLNTIYGHMGTIRNGVDMMRQLGAFLSRFR